MDGREPTRRTEPAAAWIVARGPWLQLRQERADLGRGVRGDPTRSAIRDQRIQFRRRQHLYVRAETQLIAAAPAVVLCAQDAPAARDAQCPAALAHAIECPREHRSDVRIGRRKLEAGRET